MNNASCAIVVGSNGVIYTAVIVAIAVIIIVIAEG